MKPFCSNSRPRRCNGMLLIECLVYITILAILLGVGFASFYEFWDGSAALRSMADKTGSALRAGEHWRADIRGATGKIERKTLPDETLLQIPHGRDMILYRFAGGMVCRKASPVNSWMPVLSEVKSSQMERLNRDQARAWCWNVELFPYNAKTKMHPLFTFEAVAPAQP